LLNIGLEISINNTETAQQTSDMQILVKEEGKMHLADRTRINILGISLLITIQEER